ncbi:hypothetical protein [Paenibacillus periandrae]|uniref:hypothetical protein n=1 Tax=Paenibacillus periandrae TaxID=1761741 RepID=UPI001F090980|nr:hypothetical protein [Paenibacillus periandrae]
MMTLQVISFIMLDGQAGVTIDFPLTTKEKQRVFTNGSARSICEKSFFPFSRKNCLSLQQPFSSIFRLKN